MLVRPHRNSHPRRGFKILELLLSISIVATLIAFLLPAKTRTRAAARRMQCQHNLQRIVLALHAYHDAYQVLPPACTVDAHGQPLHSWRTLVLPYLDQQALYDKIDLSRPWDDPANAEVCKTHVPCYQCSELWDPTNHTTTYLAVVTPNSCLRPTGSRRMSDLTDGRAETLLVIETDATHAVPWMAPLDADEKLVLEFGPQTDVDRLTGVHAAFADGSVRSFDPDTPAAQRQAWISIAGRGN